MGVRDVLDGKILPSGTVLVYDELGFHQGTSVAEFLADRGCAVTIATNGMVVAQDLSITLDFEGWNRRAFEKSIGQRTDLMVTSVSAGASPLASLVHLPTGVDRGSCSRLGGLRDTAGTCRRVVEHPAGKLFREISHR